jgi:cytosine deaminase
VIGENRTFGGNEDLLRSYGVDVTLLGDPTCIEMMQAFQRNHPDIWREDIGE